MDHLQDLANQLRALRAVAVPQTGLPGARLTVVGEDPFTYQFVQDLDPEIRSGHGSPNTVLTAPKGILYIDVDVPALYQNTDGLQAWGIIAGGATVPVLLFSYPGPLASGIESPPYYPPLAFTATQIRVSLLANASTNHVIEVHLNGTLITSGSVTLTTGNKTVTVAISQAFVTTDYVTVKTVNVSDSDLSVEVK